VAAGERRKHGHDVPGVQGPIGRCVATVHQHDALEVSGEAETLNHVVNGAAVGNVEDGCPVATVGG
jgi:hypothetical protein